MANYKNPAIRQLKEQQVRYAPRDARLEQIEKAERLLEELDLAREYRYQDLCQKITTYKPEMYPDLVVTGQEAAHDLRLFIEDLSDSADIKAEASDEHVLTVEDVSRQFKVSTKTVDRWRNRGLVSRRFMFGNRKRIGFLKSSIDRFVARHAGDIERGGQFSQLSDVERDEIIDRARRLSRAGGCPAEISRRIARKTGRAVETIRYTLKNHDQHHPEAAIFPNAPQPLTEDVKKEIHRGFRRGMSVDRLARRYCRTKASIYRIVGEMRAKRLLDQPIECIYNASFELPNADDLILVAAPANTERHSS